MIIENRINFNDELGIFGSWVRGKEKRKSFMTTYGLEPPLIEANPEWFAITFRRKGFQEAIAKIPSVPSKAGQRGGVSGGVNEGIENVLEFIRRTPGLRTPQISKTIQVPVKTLEKWLNQLKENNKIEFRGSDRSGGYWSKGEQAGGVNGGVNGGVSGGVNEGIEDLLEFIRRTPGLRAPQISKAVGVPVSTLEKWLKKLKDSGGIVFKGSSKSGGYRINQ